MRNAKKPSSGARADAANCHAIGNRGNRLGPELTRIGRQRSIGFLRESLLKPEADVASDYTSITVVTSDGRSIRGVQRALDEFNVVLQDFSGKGYSLDRASLKAVAEGGSPMPSYEKVLSPEELNDLLQYLMSLGAAR